MSEQPALKKLRLWRELDGRRVPVDIFTDSGLTIKKIQVGESVVNLDALITSVGFTGVNAGDPDIAGYSPLFSATPCWFEGCNQLREQYQTEAANLASKMAAEGQRCTTCDLGDIRRKYIALMRASGYPLHPSSNAQYRQVSGPPAAEGLRVGESQPEQVVQELRPEGRQG